MTKGLSTWTAAGNLRNYLSMIKILPADDHDIVRAGLGRIVEESGDMVAVAEAADGGSTSFNSTNVLPV